MTIQHHPSDSLLTAFAAGRLDRGQHIAVAIHLVACLHCRGWVRAMEEVGGAVLARLPLAAMSTGAPARIEARLGEPYQTAEAAVAPVFSGIAGSCSRSSACEQHMLRPATLSQASGKAHRGHNTTQAGCGART